jgi:hypothetical protein
MGPFENPNMPQPLPGEDLDEGITQQYSQEEVGFRPADAVGQSCARCDNFQAKAQQSMGMGVCEVVSGPIPPQGVCDLFEPISGLGGLLGA